MKRAVSAPGKKALTPEYYEIRVRGRLDASWSEWFEGLAIVADDRGRTVLSGRLQDQAALFGVLLKVRDLGLPLLAVRRIRRKRGKSE